MYCGTRWQVLGFILSACSQQVQHATDVSPHMLAGAVKILFEVGLIYWVLAKYAVASVLTYFSSEDFTNIAWDSAGGCLSRRISHMMSSSTVFV